jgi:hypothetical protein
MRSLCTSCPPCYRPVQVQGKGISSLLHPSLNHSGGCRQTRIGSALRDSCVRGGKMESGGLSAAITDEPPAGTYVVAGQRVSATKAKVGAAVLVAGVVAAAVAVTGSRDSNRGSTSAIQLQQSTGVVTFPTYVPVVPAAPPCSCTDGIHIAAQCEDLKVLISGNSRPLPYNEFAGYLHHWTREDLAGNVTWTFTCKDSGKGSRAGFIAAVRACDKTYATSSQITQFASDAQAPPFYFYADTASYPGNVANPQTVFSQADILFGSSTVSYQPSGWNAVDGPNMAPPNADWVWDNSVRGTTASPRTVVFKLTVPYWDTCSPTAVPTSTPTRWPTEPTLSPTSAPTRWPTEPTSEPTMAPTKEPTRVPTAVPTSVPTTVPTAPTAVPTAPTSEPTMAPTKEPTAVPTAPTSEPTMAPSKVPTAVPTQPTSAPTMAPTKEPTEAPTAPTSEPTMAPSKVPTAVPTAPTSEPTMAPSKVPTAVPTQPTSAPTSSPTAPSGTGPIPPPTTKSPSPSPTTAPTQPTPSPTAPSLAPNASRPPTTPTKWPTKQTTSKPTPKLGARRA